MNAPGRAKDLSARRLPRCPLTVPVRVTMRKKDSPLAIPGRSINLGEGGLAAVLSGDFHAGDSVGLEFLLPELGLGLHTRAVVRHHTDMRSGFEFMGLSLEQQAMIRRWIRKSLEMQATGKTAPPTPADTVHTPQKTTRQSVHKKTGHRPQSRRLQVAALSAILLAVAAWGIWAQDWTPLTHRTGISATSHRRIKVGPRGMEPFVLHKADATYPAGADTSPAILLVQVVVGSDGTVLEQTPVTGPEYLHGAAMQAVKEWHFEPYRVNGEPVEVETTVAVEFHPQSAAALQ